LRRGQGSGPHSCVRSPVPMLGRQTKGMNTGISDEGVACVVDGLDDDFVETMSLSVVAGVGAEAATASSQAIFDLVLNCFRPEDLQKLSS